METVFSLVSNFIVFLDKLSLFLFTPLVDLRAAVYADIPILGDLAQILDQIKIHKGFFALLELIPAVANMTLAHLLLGGGIAFLLLWRLWKFIGDGVGL